MSVSAETYIVISLMFAVFAAVAAVGTSVVLGAGFERLRAGFELIKGQSGFFADAIYKLDIRTQKLDEETAKLKSGVTGVHDRMDRVEKQTIFMADAVTSIEHRILQGSPTQSDPSLNQHDGSVLPDGMNPVHTVHYHAPEKQAPRPQPSVTHSDFMSLHNPVREQEEMEDEDSMDGGRGALLAGMFQDNRESIEQDNNPPVPLQEQSAGLGGLFSRYFQSENDKGVIYH